MPHNYRLLLVLVILILNTFVAAGYLIYGLIRTSKPNRKAKKKEKTFSEEVQEAAEEAKKEQEYQDKEKEAIAKEDAGELEEEPEESQKEKDGEEGWFAKDRTDKQESMCKYIILSIFLFFCPVAGVVFLGLGTILYNIFFDSSIDLAAITFSKERVDILEHPDVEEEINLVPMEEAIMIEDKESLRQLLLTVLRGDVSKSISAVTKALNSSDSEASHYAASAIMDITNEFQLTLQKFQAELDRTPEDPDVNQMFIEYLIRMLNAGFLSDLELKTYVYTLQHTCESVYQLHKELLKPEYYSNLVRLLGRIGDLQLAAAWIGRLQEAYPEDIEMYRCVLHFYFETKDKAGFFHYLDKLRKSDISIDKDLLELIRVFQ